jgi:hypothetical protein
MGYTAFKADAAYTSKTAAAFIALALINENDSTDRLAGAFTGGNVGDPFEVIPIEEGGNDGIDEYVQGRNGPVNVSVTMQLAPKYVDWLQSRNNYLGKRFTLLAYMEDRNKPDMEWTGTVLWAVTGVVVSSIDINHGARGAVNCTVTGQGETKYTGDQWATKTGAQ